MQQPGTRPRRESRAFGVRFLAQQDVDVLLTRSALLADAFERYNARGPLKSVFLVEIFEISEVIDSLYFGSRRSLSIRDLFIFCRYV